MDRPTITKEIVLEAAKEIAEKIGSEAHTIAQCYRHPMDGYELAQALYPDAYLDLTMSDVDVLDGMRDRVRALHRAAEARWIVENDIQPPLPIGTRIQQGVIDSVCEPLTARYIVRAGDPGQRVRLLLVKFEDAVAA